MPRLLHVQSSPNLGNSITRTLTDKFVADWVAGYANVDVDILDLAKSPLPHFGPDILAAAGPEEGWSETTREAVALSSKLVEQLIAADVLVIGAPMLNFTLCTQLKAWFDHIIVAGKTFKYAAPGIAKGLLFGKKAFVIEARGGDNADPPLTAYALQEPLLRSMLGFIGLFDVSFVRADCKLHRFDEIEGTLAGAERIIERLAA